MPLRTQRHLDILSLSRHLQDYALGRQPDINASYLLVHRAILGALAQPQDGARPAHGLRASLQADIDRLGACDACA